MLEAAVGERGDGDERDALATCANRSSMVSRSSFSRFCLSGTRSHLLTAMTSARPSSGDHIADREILVLEGVLGIDEQHHDLGEADGAHGIAGRQLLGEPR